ncbi:MAG: NHLP family bacteriocin export ABC transporter peptidase/permease/ATPase, partial [Butyrivibrio sp.]|nr:NHLP family bacteriocin export ABC transporter peptidase/permease/ATPase [Butyrivibrio sp.]
MINGKFTIGMITAFQGFLASFSAPASTFISTGQTMQELRTDMERIEDVMEYPDDDNGAKRYSKGDGGYKKLRGHVEMRNITFGYSKLADPLIKDFSLKLEPGNRVAF